ncbi:hypothetical protein ACGFH8_26800 [Micromonospora sp. NPDC049175]|uniref:hypothetical protein n=1 Tax=Micromonospora sp. NPDC049175 TaxID=3364266 RepID=UPI00371312EB
MTLIVTLIAVLMPRLSYFAAIVAFLCQIATFYLRHQGQQKQGVGDEIRRRAMLLDALEPFDQAFDLTELLRKAGTEIRNRAADSVESDYFASKAADGLVRLRDHLRENAFWNRCLYHECAQSGTHLLTIVMSSATLVFLFALAIVPSSTTANLTRVFIALMGFFVAYALLADVTSWKSASRAIESIDRRLDSIKSLSETELRSFALGELLAIFSEYTVATSKVPPIPERTYTKHRERLNTLWRGRENGLKTSLLGPAAPAGKGETLNG